MVQDPPVPVMTQVRDGSSTAEIVSDVGTVTAFGATALTVADRAPAVAVGAAAAGIQ